MEEMIRLHLEQLWYGILTMFMGVPNELARYLAKLYAAAQQLF